MGLKVIILAAGKGTRMVANLPKVLHRLGGIPLLAHVIHSAQSLNPDEVIVVYSNGGSQVREQLANETVSWVLQEEILGTGHAVMQALPHIAPSDQVLVLYGDVPLITKNTLRYLIDSSRNKVGVLVATVDDPSGLGRIVRSDNGSLQRIVEHKDANADQLRIKEINTGIMSLPGKALHEWLPTLSNDNQQREYYLTDVVALAHQNAVEIEAVNAFSQHEIQGVNNRWQLAKLERFYQEIRAKQYALAGVTIKDFRRFDVRGRDVNIARDVEIDIDVILQGSVTIAEGACIGPHVLIENSQIAENVVIHGHCVIKDSVIAAGATIGPFAHIHEGCHVGEKTLIGNFVECKRSHLSDNVRAKHLSYLGDVRCDEGVNVGAGTITCNFDGKRKSKTHIGSRAMVGANTSLIAPIKIGDDATVAAGSVVSKDVPAKALSITRANNKVYADWSQQAKDVMLED